MPLYAGIKRKWLVRTIIGFIFFPSSYADGLNMMLLLADKNTPMKAQKWQLPTVPLEPYQKERIRVFLSDNVDTADAGWNKLQAQVAVGSGGLRGKGYLQGTQNMLGFLPRTVAPTDFIFCVIAEEMGFIGSISILLLYMLLLGRCLRTAWRAPDEFGRMVAIGINTYYFAIYL